MTKKPEPKIWPREFGKSNQVKGPKLPIAAKFEALIRMQRSAGPVLRARGLGWKAWMTSEIYQLKEKDPIRSDPCITISVAFDNDWKVPSKPFRITTLDSEIIYDIRGSLQ